METGQIVDPVSRNSPNDGMLPECSQLALMNSSHGITTHARMSASYRISRIKVPVLFHEKKVDTNKGCV